MHVAPFAGDHLDGTLDVLQRAMLADPIGRATFARKVLLDPNFDPEGALVALDAGRGVGFVLAIVRRFPLEDAPPDTGSGYVTLLAVAPEARGRGIGSELLKRAEAYLASRGCTRALISPYAPGYFIPGVDVTVYADCLAFLQRRGYSVISRPIAMECDLTALQTPDWVVNRERQLVAEGIAVEPYTTARTPALFAFLRAHFPGDWQRFARSAADRIEQGEPASRLWLALSGDEVIGYAHHEVERFGPIGVAQEWRGRGIGHVLMYRTLAAMRLQNLHTAWFLWTDERTASRLYAAAGFRVTRKFSVLARELRAEG